MIGEGWKYIRGYEGLYVINEYGVILSLNYKNTKQTKELKKSIKDGYEYVTLTKNNKVKFLGVHRLVYSTFYDCDIPKEFEVRDEFPKTLYSKVDYKQLEREELEKN